MTASEIHHTTGSEYIAGWDGVRALAVGAVVVFHLDSTLLPGGFLGVTMFFVLAGALATVRIDRAQRRTDGFDLGAYAGGRVRRLLPALLVYVTVVMVWVWIDRPALFESIGRDAIAALLYVTPWREMTEPGGYAGAFAVGPEPLLHTWSLGVEEAAWIVTGLTIAVSRRVWTAAAATGAIGVLGYVLWFGEADLYYSPARLLEFAAGATLALVMIRWRPAVPWWLGGLGAVALVALMIDTRVVDTYEGRLVLAALASAALIAAATTRGVGGVLAWSPLRWIGTRSYSIYLWHVGLIELTDLPAIGVVIATGVLAEASYRLVESPARARRAPMRMAPALLGLTVLSVGVLTWGPVPAPDAPFDAIARDDLEAIARQSITVAEQDTAIEGGDTTVTTVTSVTSETTQTLPEVACTDCARSPIDGAADYSLGRVFTEADDPVEIAIIGDSTGVFLGIALEQWATTTGEAVIHDLTVGGCSPLSFAGSGWYRTRISEDDPGETEREGCMPTIADVPAATDLVVVLVPGTPLLDHLRPDGEWVDLTDPAMADVLAQWFALVATDADDRGLPLIAATGATMPDSTIASMRDPARAFAFGDVLSASGIRTYDLTTPLESGDYLRYDGTHLHADTVLPLDGPARNEAHRYVAEVMGPALVAFARGPG